MAALGVWSAGQAAAVRDLLAAYWPGQEPAEDSAVWRLWRGSLQRFAPGWVVEAIDGLRRRAQMPELDEIVAAVESRRAVRADM